MLSSQYFIQVLDCSEKTFPVDVEGGDGKIGHPRRQAVFRYVAAGRNPVVLGGLHDGVVDIGDEFVEQPGVIGILAIGDQREPSVSTGAPLLGTTKSKGYP